MWTRHLRCSPWRSARAWLLLAGGEIVAASFLAIPDARSSLAIFLILCGAGSVLALAAARSLSASTLAFVLLCGGLFRATLVLRPPDLSDDLNRYLWDARVAAAGISPYAYVPSDPAVAHVAPALRARVPHADVRTVYPPVAQAVFRAGGALGGEGFALKGLFALADLSIVALLASLGGPGAGFASALYAFHPLPIFESAGEGHVDSLGVALLLASLVFLQRGRSVRAGIGLALSVLTKYVSAFAVLPLLRRGRLRLAASALAVGAAVWIAWSRGAVTPVGGLGDYATRWEFNSLAYPALTGVLNDFAVPGRAKRVFQGLKEHLHHPGWMQPLFPYFYAEFFARAALAVALVLALVAIAWRVRNTETAVFASLAAALLASPTLQPWYLLWILPFAALAREPGFLFLCFAAPLSYGLLYPVHGLTAGRILLLEYGPFALLLLWSWRRARAARRLAEAAA